MISGGCVVATPARGVGRGSGGGGDGFDESDSSDNSERDSIEGEGWCAFRFAFPLGLDCFTFFRAPLALVDLFFFSSTSFLARSSYSGQRRTMSFANLWS